ncbi:hypothetical protein OSB04_012759 [Centaurea solstitialis]|uniref:FAS1 domain-containing protein n=1 Tax=Centaurea solstitialis TaxID=347529 RepID=A0AA38TNN6_9ASTR|nr:hypothetical protein OSB04_012759 [Centaurea solstitialis]
MPTSLHLFLLLSTVALTTTTTHLRRLSAVDLRPPSPENPPSTPHHLLLSAESALPIPPPVSTQPPPPPPQSPPEYIQQEELKNIIDALIGAGDFAAWANILLNPTTNSSTTTAAALIPTTATMFVPRNEALAHLTATSFDPFIIPYHILPQRLTFSDLQLSKTLTRLPTLLPSKTVIITNNTPSNFTVDDALIIRPDFYLTPAVCVHGIGALLDYTVYGDHDADSTTPVPSLSLPLPMSGGQSEPKHVIVRNSCGTICVVERIGFVMVMLLLVIVSTLNLLITCLHFGRNFE